MSLPHLTAHQWWLAAIAALCIGLAKSGFAGVGTVTVLLMAEIMPARESTGAVLPLLICGDIFASAAFRRHAQWRHIWRMLPPALAGVVVGYFLMQRIKGDFFRPVIGWIVLVLVILQVARKWKPGAFDHVPHTRWFAWLMGSSSGIATMMANAAGPIMTLYLLAINLPKIEFVGTSALFFLIVNVIKVPFSAHLGLINGSSLALNVILVPFVALGILIGRRMLAIVPQQLFEILVLIFAIAASIRLILF